MHFGQMNRRKLLALLGGAAASWPVVARAQQGEGVRHIGVLMGWSETDPLYRIWFAAFVQALARFGWVEGANLRIEQRWTNAEFERIAPFAKELVERKPDVILSGTTPVTVALHRETITIPIVFAIVSDPIGAGLVAGVSRPGGNITGFINVEAGMGGKWLDLLKEIAPRIIRAAIMFNPDTAPGGGSYFLDSFEVAAQSLGVEAVTVRVRSDAEIETAITSLGRERAGLVSMTDSFMDVHRGTVIASAARNNVPAIFDGSQFARAGGLISYGPNYADIFRRAAGHVDRILRGAKPADLPVEVPTRFDLVINLKTARALGLTIPESFLARADEVIE
jgi:putative ABC transport system substrate-binding protein